MNARDKPSDSSVGWIGVGKMGEPMCHHLLKSGFTLSVYEPVPSNRAAILAAGAHEARSPSELADSCEIIVAMIPNDAVLRSIVFGDHGLTRSLRPGQVFIEMSTVSPHASAEVAVALDEIGTDYVRAPVSGSTQTAAEGRLTVLASGPKAAFQRIEPVLAVFSARRFHVGEGEQARYLKLVLNTLVGATAPILAEALSLGRKGGLSMQTMLDVIAESAVASPLIAYKRELLLGNDFEAAFSVEQMIKDFDLIGDTARRDHVPMYLAALVRQQYEAALVDGGAARDFFVLIERQARLAGLHAGHGEVPEPR